MLTTFQPNTPQIFPAELVLADVQAPQLVAFVQLYRALGGGWWLAERK